MHTIQQIHDANFLKILYKTISYTFFRYDIEYMFKWKFQSLKTTKKNGLSSQFKTEVGLMGGLDQGLLRLHNALVWWCVLEVFST